MISLIIIARECLALFTVLLFHNFKYSSNLFMKKFLNKLCSTSKKGMKNTSASVIGCLWCSLRHNHTKNCAQLLCPLLPSGLPIRPPFISPNYSQSVPLLTCTEEQPLE
ncbi:unnamed protein product [Moneuplotes crassus]|uniref:Uncharacterized protein n=1 Tax=Euplotes crassus TaxID=5936 RepID=A0AAD2D4Y3_EUPCR|nr:unnamed protein product [Moneuplotes crassus]